MNWIEVGTREKALILVGLVLATAGFGVHLIIPGTGRSGIVIVIQPIETKIDTISLSPGSVEQSFRFDFLGPDHPNLTIYLLNETQFETYQSGTSLSNITDQILLDADGRGVYTQLIDTDTNFYLILVNTHSESLTFSYYYSLMPTTFFPSAIIGFIGLILIVLGFAWHYLGWKRYFLIGLGINLAIFLVRIFTLSQYSLGLPDIFLDVIQVELYNDYQYFYLSWIPNLWQGAWVYSSDLPVYLYPPLWIYTVGLFGATPPWLPGAVLFSFNIATGIIVYKIAQRISENEKTSILAMMIYLLNPITVLYGSFMWLNPTPFVFFVMLSFYLALTNKAEYSIISLAIATLYKQFAVVFFPILAIFLIKQISNRSTKTVIFEFLKQTLIYSVIIGLVSLPFLIVSPNEYYYQVLALSRGNLDRLTYFTPQLSIPVHFGSFFLWIFGTSVFTDVLAWLIYYYVFLLVCGLVVYGTFAFTESKKDDISWTSTKHLFMKAIFWSLIAVLCLQTFFPRGVYKFYLLILMPFAALLFDYKDLELQKEIYTFEKHHLFVPITATVIFLCYRFVYLWIVIVWAWFYLYRSGELSRIRNGISSFFSRLRTPPSSSTERMKTLDEIYSE